jgi:carbamoyl-phosphate synthase large subunit
MKRTDPITVCVTGVGGGGIGEQLVKALRLAKTSYRIVVTDTTPHSAGLSRGDAHEIVPLASAPEYLERIMDTCSRHGARALLPGSEAELKVLSPRRDEVAARGIFLPLNTEKMIATCMNKMKFAQVLADMDINAPWFVRVRSIADVGNLPGYPAVFKPSVGSGGSANTFIVQDPGEARWTARHLCSMYPEFIAQEYVGTPDSEYTVGVLSDLDGEWINSIAVRRYTTAAMSCRLKVPNRTGRSELGDTLLISSGISQGEIGRFPEVTEPCAALAKALGSCGPCNIQLRYVGGRIFVFEINPRFSGTTSLRAMAGFNEPDILIRKHLLGEHVEQGFPFRGGVIMRRLEETFVEEHTQ